MALIWFDGFDQYGTSTTNMLDGVYAQVYQGPGSDAMLTASEARTGGMCLRFSGNDGAGFRKTLGKTLVGNDGDIFVIGFAFRFNALPTSNSRMFFVSVRDNANSNQCTIGLTTTGQYEVRRGSNSGTLLATSDQVVTAGAWAYFEAKIRVHETEGYVIIRHNTVEVLRVENVDTQALANSDIAQYLCGTGGNATGLPTWRMDDMYVLDNSGVANIDFLGDRKVIRTTPDADLLADWLLSSGATGYSLINNAVPNDANYIYADTVGDISTFEISNLPLDTTTVSGVMMLTRMLKSDSGDCNVQQSVISNAVEGNGVDRPITTVATYWWDIWDENPDGNVAWIPAAVNDLQVKFERTV